MTTTQECFTAPIQHTSWNNWSGIIWRFNYVLQHCSFIILHIVIGCVIRRFVLYDLHIGVVGEEMRGWLIKQTDSITALAFRYLYFSYLTDQHSQQLHVDGFKSLYMNAYTWAQNMTGVNSNLLKILTHKEIEEWTNKTTSLSTPVIAKWFIPICLYLQCTFFLSSHWCFISFGCKYSSILVLWNWLNY